jgi:hypothetical protein
MIVTFDGKIIGELQGLSYTVTREKAPLYTMGSADPRSFSRGKRGIAGSLIFLVFDRSALLDTMKERGLYLANAYEIYGRQSIREINPGITNNIFQSNADGKVGESVALINATDEGGSNVITNDKVIATPMYHDQIPPFDIVVSAANEYGSMAQLAIQNVEILNCGSGLSIDDITTDEACTFIATAIIPWSHQYSIDTRTALGQVPTPSPTNFSGARPSPI